MAKEPTLNPCLREFWEKPARNRILYGGRNSSKTWDTAGFAIFLACNYSVRFLCVRQFQNRIEDSVYSVLKKQIERFNVKTRFKILRNKIINKETGSEFIFYGLWRHIDEIKSLESVDICWIEEAHNLTKRQWEFLEPTLRADSSQFWIVFNPQYVTDFVYQRFVVNTPPDTILRKINYTENPFISETALKIINNMREEDPDEFAHIYLGEPRETNDETIIQRKWVEASIDAHKKLHFTNDGCHKIGFDVADSGGDLNVAIYRKGSTIYELEAWQAEEDELIKSCMRVYNFAKTKNYASIIYDSVGVGAFCGSFFEELNQQNEKYINFYKFNAGSKVINPDEEFQPQILNKDYFENLKAQSWVNLATRFRNTYNAIQKNQLFDETEMISLSSDLVDLEKLIIELCVVRKDFSQNGKFMAESKQKLSKRQIKSPNYADALVAVFAELEAEIYDYGSLL